MRHRCHSNSLVQAPLGAYTHMPSNSPALTAVPNREPLPENDPQEKLPSQNKFFAIIYSCAFLLSVGNGFLSGKASFIAVDWFAGAECAGVKTDKCDPSIALSCTCKSAVTQYALVSGANSFASLGFALFAVPFLTRASDAFGRRVFIQVGSVMSCWSISVFLYLITGLKWSLWLMFVLSFVASQSPASTVSVSSILDVCPTEDKSKVLGRRAALFVLGNCVGLGAGYFLSELQASIACFICSLLSVAVHILFWPETLLKRHRVPFTRGASNPFRPLLFFFIKKSYRSLFIVMLTEQLAGAGFSALIFQYTRQAFNAGTSLFSLALATFNLATAMMPGVLLPILQNKLKCSDFLIIRIGIVGMAAAFSFLAFFKNVYMFFNACVFLGFGGLISPAANAIISTYISDKDQGLAQGAFSSVASLSAILAQVIFEPMFVLGISKYDNAGFAFYFAFIFCVIALACAVIFEQTFRTEKHEMSHPRYSAPRRAVIFGPLDMVELDAPLTVANSKNCLQFAFQPTDALRQTLVDASANNDIL